MILLKSSEDVLDLAIYLLKLRVNRQIVRHSSCKKSKAPVAQNAPGYQPLEPL